MSQLSGNRIMETLPELLQPIVEAQPLPAISSAEFLEAVESGDLTTVQASLATDADYIALHNEEGYHAVHLATKAGHRHILRALLDHRPELKDQPTSDDLEHVPLHFAALKGHFAILRDLLLIRSAVDRRSKHGATPLHLAATRGLLQTVEPLVEAGADVNAATNTGSTPLIAATYGGYDSVVACLLRNHACPYQKNSNGESAITIATQQKRKGVLRLLHAAVFPEETLTPLPPLAPAPATPPLAPPPAISKTTLGVSPSGSTASS